MGSVHEEYGRFMQLLRSAEVSEDARRIAKIVEDNLDALIPTVSNGGQRPNALTPMLRHQLESTTDHIEAVPEQATAASLTWTRLHKLTIGPFRGFRREEQFDLDKDIVLFYGPNGSGKSSLCEAIEFALLGHVEEAVAKRIDDLNDYFDNIHERRHVVPQLWSASGANGVLITPNAELLRFAIIEKNRIEGFARLAARPPAQAGTLIAALFGLDGFNEFVNNFTTALDRQLQLATPQQTELTLRRAKLETARQKVDGNEATIQAFDAEQEKIAGDLEENLTFAQLIERLGLNGQPGKLQDINARIDEQIPIPSGLSRQGIAALRKNLRQKLTLLADCNAKLEARVSQVSYRDLYRAVGALQKDNANACPACETPLTAVISNPFERAAHGLALLQDLAALEAEQAGLRHECGKLSAGLRDKMLVAHNIVPFESEVLRPLLQWIEEDDPRPAWSDGFLSRRVWGPWLKVVQFLERRDAGICVKQAQRAELIEERRRLETVKERIDELRGRRNHHVQQIADERVKLQHFDEVNAELIHAATLEAAKHQSETRIQIGYAHYLDSLKRYRDGLPERLLADLNETTRDLYNQFNVGDHENDKLVALSLPLRSGERIQLAFAGCPQEFHDALHVLSEGHLRCLGLAILLAKNIKLGLPLLVFDDAVNAIDFDHRAGIRATLFGDPQLKTKQLIITCHSNEFIKAIQNELAEGSTKLYVLDNHIGDYQPRVRNGSDRHYLGRARERLHDGDSRQCLASCRQALENLTLRVWQKLVNKNRDLGRMSLTLWSPAGHPELRNLTDELAKCVTKGIKQGTLQGDAWTRRQESFQELLDVPEGHIAWLYLNKATHDGDREDFEIQIVRQIVSALGKLSDSFNT